MSPVSVSAIFGIVLLAVASGVVKILTLLAVFAACSLAVRLPGPNRRRPVAEDVTARRTHSLQNRDNEHLKTED